MSIMAVSRTSWLVAPACAPSGSNSTNGMTGFPPAAFHVGAEGEAGYSPYVQLPNGTILNAPIVADESGQADKVKDLDTAHGMVRIEETAGFANGSPVMYVSTDASVGVAAALENVTLAPALNAAPDLGQDGTDQARSSLAKKIGLGQNQRRIVIEVAMILNDMRHAIRSIGHLLRIRDLCVRFIVDFERRFEVTVIIGRIDSREVQLHNEFMKLRLRNAIRSHFPISIQPAS